MNVLKNKTPQKYEELLAALYDLMLSNNDNNNAKKIIDLYDKVISNEFVISFTGHFSAGKSSIINFILNKDVLPKSPIPTSANIVKLRSGDGLARVYFKDEEGLEYNEPYDIDVIKDYCQNRDTIQQIEISTSEAILPKQSVIMDTPGIDAADDADRMMTESALHIIDILFYVMDYNHVQSEVNLDFLKKIQKYNIPIYIVINQIDKHNNEEISFKQFETIVKQTFDQWGIYPEYIYFTSALQLNDNNNDIHKLKDHIYQLLHSKKNMRHSSAIKQVVTEHKQFIENKYKDKLNEFEEGHVSQDEKDFKNVEIQLNKLGNRLEQLNNEFHDELNLTLKNAYLMPATLRDNALKYLESEEKNFKIGFINWRKKTREEQEERQSYFLNQLNETIETTIQWKLREKFIELAHKYDINIDSLVQSVQQLNVTCSLDDVRSFIKEGATLNGSYVLNYTNDLSHHIKSKFRHQAHSLWDRFKITYEEQTNDLKKELIKQLNQFRVTQEKYEEYTNVEDELKYKLMMIDGVMDSPLSNENLLNTLRLALRDIRSVKKAETLEETIITQTDHHSLNDQIGQQDEATVSLTSSMMIDEINAIISDVESLSSVSSIISDLKDKKEKLTDRQLTIALFGAFSAGKSSFSNALLGERILPVSPNPTTAVINRIRPITNQYKHGHVVLTFKNDKTLYNDLFRMIQEFAPKAQNAIELIAWIKTEKIYENDDINNMYQAYLQAISHGFENNKQYLGKSISITLDEFASFVTDETKACYLETVDLYYDCSLTRQGITLVDTPGADSVNARHTNVSFDYIKEADAILYVTYYNHAVTSADRDFLMQLGRVKESFELDKMFFIVNAADLAQSEDDLSLVLQYVEEQLLKLGIRQAKTFPVSSKNSLDEKLNQYTLNEQMTHFEKQFYTFIEEDLTKMTVQSAMWDVKRLQMMIQQQIETAHLDITEKEHFIHQLEDKTNEAISLIKRDDENVSYSRLINRIDRQLHFVSERLFIRFHDMFTEHFNPTTVTESGRKAQQQLIYNRNELIDYIGYELLQELRAVSLRIEAYMNEILKQLYESLQQQMNDIDGSFVLPSYESQTISTPVYEQAFVNLDLNIFDKALRVFRNTKSFFQDNEREKMRDTFYDILNPLTEKYLDMNANIMKEHYGEAWQELIKKIKNASIEELKQIKHYQIQVVDETIDIVKLEKHNKFLQKTLSKFD